MKIYQEKLVSVKDVNRIRIDTSSLDAELVQDEDDVLKVQIQGEGDEEAARQIRLDIHQESDTLIIRADFSGHWSILHLVGTWNKWLKLKIYVPARVFDEIETNGLSGDITAQRVMAGALSLTSQSGDIVMEDCAAREAVKVRSSSGDVKLTGVLGKGTVSARASSGDVVLSGLTAETVTISTRSGDIGVSDYRGALHAEAGSGDIRIRNDCLAADVEVRASSGDIMIAFEQEPESFAVNYQGSSGDGNVHIGGLTYKEKSDHRIIGQKGDGRYSIHVRTSSGDFVLN